jgi:hypothetical protein
MLDSTGLEFESDTHYYLRFFEDYGSVEIFENKLIGGGTEVREMDSCTVELNTEKNTLKHLPTGSYLVASDGVHPSENTDAIVLSQDAPNDSTEMVLEAHPEFQSILCLKRKRDGDYARYHWLKVSYASISFGLPRHDRLFRFQLVPKRESLDEK